MTRPPRRALPTHTRRFCSRLVSPALGDMEGRRDTRGQALLCAETAHALVGVLAASPLTVGSKQKSAALRADFSFVASAAIGTRLPLRVLADPDQQSRPRVVRPSTRPVVRENGGSTRAVACSGRSRGRSVGGPRCEATFDRAGERINPVLSIVGLAPRRGTVQAVLAGILSGGLKATACAPADAVRAAQRAERPARPNSRCHRFTARSRSSRRRPDKPSSTRTCGTPAARPRSRSCAC